MIMECPQSLVQTHRPVNKIKDDCNRSTTFTCKMIKCRYCIWFVLLSLKKGIKDGL